MDEGDISVELYERFLSLSLHNAQDVYNSTHINLKRLEERGIVNKCKYCDEVIDGYSSAFCAPESDWSCAAEYEKEINSKNRVMKVVDND